VFMKIDRLLGAMIQDEDVALFKKDFDALMSGDINHPAHLFHSISEENMYESIAVSYLTLNISYKRYLKDEQDLKMLFGLMQSVRESDLLSRDQFLEILDFCPETKNDLFSTNKLLSKNLRLIYFNLIKMSEQCKLYLTGHSSEDTLESLK
jgi:DNA-directed RNA polymerase sigma subunit (sigma70/sigma32)